jgi:hypothetical protein
MSLTYDSISLLHYDMVRPKGETMKDKAFSHSGDYASIREHPRAFDAIVYSGLIVGILDGLFAFL